MSVYRDFAPTALVGQTGGFKNLYVKQLDIQNLMVKNQPFIPFITNLIEVTLQNMIEQQQPREILNRSLDDTPDALMSIQTQQNQLHETLTNIQQQTNLTTTHTATHAIQSDVAYQYYNPINAQENHVLISDAHGYGHWKSICDVMPEQSPKIKVIEPEPKIEQPLISNLDTFTCNIPFVLNKSGEHVNAVALNQIPWVTRIQAILKSSTPEVLMAPKMSTENIKTQIIETQFITTHQFQFTNPGQLQKGAILTCSDILGNCEWKMPELQISSSVLVSSGLNGGASILNPEGYIRVKIGGKSYRLAVYQDDG